MPHSERLGDLFTGTQFVRGGKRHVVVHQGMMYTLVQDTESGRTFSLYATEMIELPNEKCAKSEKYQGKRVPRCYGGAGCNACWKKYWTVNKEKLKK